MSLLRRKLRLKFIIVLVGIASLPFFFAMTAAISRFQDDHQKQAVLNEELLASSASSEVSEFIAIQFRDLDVFRNIYPILLGNSDSSEIFLERILFSNESFAEIAVVNLTGQETIRVSRSVAVTPQDLADRSQNKEFISIKENDYFIGDVFWDKGRPFFLIGRRILDARGNFFGSVFAQIDARIMQNVVSDLSITKEKSRAYIVDQKGFIVAHPDISEVFARKNFSFIPVVRELVEKDAAVVLNDTYNNELGERVLGAGVPISVSFGNSPRREVDTGWFVVSETPAFVALAAVREITIFTFIMLIGILFISIVAAVLLARRVINPIEKLQQGAQQIGLGNLDYIIKVHTNDELQDLAEEFDRMRIRIKEVREREQLLSHMKSEFVTIAAHQLRSPLSSVKWALKLLINGEFGDLKLPQEEFLKKSYETNERMIGLVNDLLDVSRIEEGKFGYQFREENIEEILKTEVDNFLPVAKRRNIKLVFLPPSEDFPPIRLDRQKMELLIENLLDNAIRYTLPGGSVTVSLELEKSFIRVKIKDTGIGIPTDLHKRIFTKFFRGDNVIKIQTDGSGLGLFIVKNIIKKHGGEIWFESKEGRGTTFYFSLPLKSGAVSSEIKSSLR